MKKLISGKIISSKIIDYNLRPLNGSYHPDWREGPVAYDTIRIWTIETDGGDILTKAGDTINRRYVTSDAHTYQEAIKLLIADASKRLWGNALARHIKKYTAYAMIGETIAFRAKIDGTHIKGRLSKV